MCNSSKNAAEDEGAWYIQVKTPSNVTWMLKLHQLVHLLKVIRAAATQSEEDTLLDFIREEMIEFYSAVSVREINAVR